MLLCCYMLVDFARGPSQTPIIQGLEFFNRLIILQCVDELGKTCNQLTVISFPEIALNNIVEQDHRAVKRVTRPMLGFKSFDAAQDTLVGIELMHMIKKRQMIMETGEEGLTAAELFYSLAA
jgi:hypothetical protein